MSAQKSRPKGVLSGIFGMLSFSVIAGVLVTVMVTPALAVTGVTASNGIGIFDSLPEFIEIGDQPQKNEIYATNGSNPDGTPIYEQVAQVYSQNREEVQWEQVSQFLKDAVVAGEDRRFYEHSGVDLQGVIRAAIGNASGTSKSGASTLSMQLVKNIYIQRALQEPTEEERAAGIKAAQASTFDRKIKEMKLAIGLEKRYTKDEILLAYLNIAGFGGNNYGIESAAQRYFGVSSTDVTLAQSASLVAIVQEPGARSLDDPANYPANQQRRDVILKNMLVEGMIDQAQLDEALATPIDPTTVVLQPYSNGCIAAHAYATYFCDYVTTLIPELESLGASAAERETNWELGGYKVYTTLDLRLQTVAQDSVVKNAPAGETRFKLGASTVSVQPGTGRILTMAQNKTYNNTEAAASDPTLTAVNYNTDRNHGGSSGFQVGSTYKVFTLLNWLQSGHGLNEVVDGNARTLKASLFTDTCTGGWGGTWPFKNSAGETGNRTVMAATAQSINGAYASMGLQLDQCETKKIAERLGVHPANPDLELESNPAAILGTNVVAPLSMAAAYAGIANHGVYCHPVAIDSITNDNDEVLPGQAQQCTQAIEPEIAATAAFALAGAMNTYNGNPRDGTEMIGKTGTTDKSNQTWLMSSSTTVTTAVWFGNIVGDYSIARYASGLNNRHVLAKPINAAANDLYPGGSFDDPAQRLITGAGITVPDLVGGTAANAESILTGLKLGYADGGAVDSDLPEGVVVRTDPGADAVAARGQTVTVYTSNGVQGTMPDVVSAGQDFESAKAFLADSGFTAVSETCVAVGANDKSNIGKVMSSNPGAGSPAKVTDEVKLGVGKEKC
jgi:membrane peptidoglycan carboxypeptidase